jgi:predicted metal-dependent HD superfamily phosphohydrolase
MTNCGSFLLRIQRAKRLTKESPEETNILVRRPYSHLAADLRKVYEDQEQVNIIVDRRYDGDRRKEFMPVNYDCRVADRRNHTERNWQMNLIVKRPYSYLTDDLQRVFKAQEDVNIIVDSRHRDNERRNEDKSIPEDRRCGDRRSTNETLVEVVISY